MLFTVSCSFDVSVVHSFNLSRSSLWEGGGFVTLLSHDPFSLHVVMYNLSIMMGRSFGVYDLPIESCQLIGVGM